MNEIVHGWCIEYTHQGAAPTLNECEVVTTSTNGLFTQQEGPELLRIHTFGVTFFYDMVPALKGLIERLEDAKEGHRMAIAYIEAQIEEARGVLKDAGEKKQGDAPPSGAKPRC